MTAKLPWPLPLLPAAYYGLPGEIVNTLDPYSEADPVGILVHLLGMVGIAVGRSPHVKLGSRRHYLHTNFLLIGSSGGGRKGTASSDTQQVFDIVQSNYRPIVFDGGLSSGEGLIFHLHKSSETSRGVLIIEEEFSGVLAAKRREGSILAQIIRQLWDRGGARTLTLHNPVEVQNAHVSIVGHITNEELEQLRGATDTANGFLNRFMVIAVRRSKLLPESESPSPDILSRLAEKLESVISFGRDLSEMQLSTVARERWKEIYVDLARESTGAVGHMRVRASAHVMRLACIYAVCDRSRLVERPHLEAALALWSYSEHSLMCFFKYTTGHAGADRLLAQLWKIHPKSLTATEVQRFFGNHSANAKEALQILSDHGLVKEESVAGTGGRARTLISAKQANEANEYGKPCPDNSLHSHNSPDVHDGQPNDEGSGGV